MTSHCNLGSTQPSQEAGARLADCRIAAKLHEPYRPASRMTCARGAACAYRGGTIQDMFP